MKKIVESMKTVERTTLIRRGVFFTIGIFASLLTVVF